MKPKSKFFKKENSKYFMVSIGKGKPIIFIPGWMAMPDDLPFQRLITPGVKKALERYELNYVQFSNFYKSSYSERPYTLDDYAEDLKGFIDANKWEKVHLIGHSAGGRHILYFTHKYPQYVDKLVLMNAAGFKSPKLKEERLERAKFYFAKFFATPSKKEKILKPTFANIYNSDLTEIIPEIKHKTLIVWGEKDKEMNVKKAYKFKELLSNSELTIFKNLDHMTIREPEVYEKIFEFLDEK